MSKQVSNQEGSKQTVKQQEIINVKESDLPLHCPIPDQTLWSQHPRVFMAFDKEGRASCPYCGNRYQLIE